MKLISRLIIKVISFLGIACVILLCFPRIYTYFYSYNRIYSSSTVPAQRVAIVFGAGLKHDGTPTAILQDRVDAAAELYFMGKIEKIIMSGDNRFVTYNEPGAMTQYATSLGVPPEFIIQDFAGRRTYDTCYRAKHIFKVDKAILVTQRFHLPRALFTCNMLKIESIGVSSDRRTFRSETKVIWGIRETFATFTACVDVLFRHPLPVLGNPEPIFPESDS